MKRPIVVFYDWQHIGKPSPAHASDLGTSWDLDGDGIVHDTESEVHLNGYVLVAACSRSRELGQIAIPVCDGHYNERHDRVNAMTARFKRDRDFRRALFVYVPLHLNAFDPPGDYGLIGYHHKSRKGPDLAKAVAEILQGTCPELQRVITRACSPTDWVALYHTFRGVKEPICIGYEPAFLAQPQHRPLFTASGLARLGRVLPEAIDLWAQTA